MNLTAEIANKTALSIIKDRINKEWSSVQNNIERAMNDGKFSVDVDRLSESVILLLSNPPYKFIIEEVQTGINEYNSRIKW